MTKHKMKPDKEYYRDVLKLLGRLASKTSFSPTEWRRFRRVQRGTELRLDLVVEAALEGYVKRRLSKSIKKEESNDNG